MPPEHGGGEGLRVRDTLGGSEADTPYPGDMVDEPVRLEKGEDAQAGEVRRPCWRTYGQLLP